LRRLGDISRALLCYKKGRDLAPKDIEKVYISKLIIEVEDH